MDSARHPGSRPEARAGIRHVLGRPMVQFWLAGVLASLVLAWGGAVMSRRAGTTEATHDAIEVTNVVAKGIIEPNITPALLAGDPEAIAGFDAIIRNRVLDDSVARVKLWRSDGVVVYSDEPQLIGTSFALEEDELEAMALGIVAGEVSDVTGPENAFERAEGELMEVYRPVQAPSGEKLLYETYYRLSAVAASSHRIWLAFIPIILGSLALLQAVQLPLAWSLTERLRHGQQERERLLERALAASEAERRNIAADVHDGVIQDLVAVSFSLSATAETAETVEESRALLRRAASSTRRAIRSLRTLVVDIYPPDLEKKGLEAALSDLVADVASDGVTATLDMVPGLACSAADRALIYRTSLEALRNTVKHARADEVRVTVSELDGGRVVLEIVDDGVGFDVDDVLASPRDGHVGLPLLASFAEEASAGLEIHSAPGAGTRVTLKVGGT